MIEVTDLHKSFGAVQAVRGVTFTAQDGGITALLGPNGAGKSTTLRMLYTLLTPDSGTARVDGFDTQTQALAARRVIGVLPDARGLYPRLTARENIRYYGQLHGLSGAPLETRINTLIQLLDLAAEADRRTEGFSTGQRLKVAIARAIVHQPRNVMLDEPTNGLDVLSTRAMREVIRRLRDDGQCVLFTSHVMQEVAALCDQLVVIAGGRVVFMWSDHLIARTQQSNLEEAYVKVLDDGGHG